MNDPTGTHGAEPLPEALAHIVCERLLEVSADEQGKVMEELFAEHPDHREGLRRVYAEISGVDRVLGDRVAAATAAERPVMIGNYQIIRQVGEGAFGVVYLCAQTTPMERQVAVKLLRPGAGSRQTLARFQAERQVLARMNHPAIANVFDAGAAADGRPYFAMEYVDGATITSFCDGHRLTVSERLGLFLALCEGVQYAHQRGVIHRDLKPSNVLVCDVQGKAQPKIIDFGLAKVMEPGTARNGLTETGRVLGTPGFMSPEQGDGRHDDVDTRTDVFSLGVILYVLLAGEMPWRRGEPAADAVPIRPSVRVASESSSSSAVASQRSAEPRRLHSLLRGDLDWIVLRALERDRDRRYQTVQELAEDIRRHQCNEPVHAGPPSTLYRLHKLVRRYRIQAIAAAAVVASLLAGLAGTLVYANRASANLQRFEILAIGSRLAVARAGARDLYPPWPERRVDFERWLEHHGLPLRQELARLRAALVDLRAQALPYTAVDHEAGRRLHPLAADIDKRRATLAYVRAVLEHPALAEEPAASARKTLTEQRDRIETELPALERALQERRSWRFDSESQQFLHDTMTRIESDLSLFCEARGCTVDVVAAQCNEIVAEMADGERWRDVWERVRTEMERDPRYRGVRLAPQFGLVPVGRDPESGLQEFYHLRSGPSGGVAPGRGADGRLQLDEKSGIVFVLLPGGTVPNGAQRQEPSAPCYDPYARVAESPVHEVTLAPFFIGKHEVTQNQWWYLTDTLPSHFHKATSAQNGRGITPRHPVENVTWVDGQRGLERQGLDLPTEAQWEYACRAGTTSVWPTGDSAASLAGFANVADQAAKLLGAAGDENLDDGSHPHSPVGSFAANAFGLHDMVGNVAEWCRDHFSSLAYLLRPRPGDGLRPIPEMHVRAVRGGGFENLPSQCTSAARHPLAHNARDANVGVRAARRVQGAVEARK